LDENLDEAGIKAIHENGILSLSIPKVHPTNNEPVVRKIEIQ
jgi:HSP20 family molecular chaperone IbpA